MWNPTHFWPPSSQPMSLPQSSPAEVYIRFFVSHFFHPPRLFQCSQNLLPDPLTLLTPFPHLQTIQVHCNVYMCRHVEVCEGVLWTCWCSLWLKSTNQPNTLHLITSSIGATALLRMRSVFSQMAAFVKDGGRLRHIMDKGHKTKMHTYIQVCGTMGAYAVWSASASGTESGRLGQNQAMAIIGLLQAMGELWNHSINRCVASFYDAFYRHCCQHPLRQM